MALDSDQKTALLIHRFGLIPKAGGLAAAGTDARAALLAELDKPKAGQIVNDDLLDSGEAYRAAADYRQSQRAQRLAARAKGSETERAANPDMQSGEAGMKKTEAAPKQNQGPGIPQQIYREEAKARFDAALDAPLGFAERLVWFWSNHFCVSADKAQVRPICGAFEREAIRPHISGKFIDMLMAVESHPAMLLYLDNARSIGPNSPAGQRRGRGLNENLAREILELHTVGVNGGYTQDDVTNFAKVITGWSIVPPREDAERGGTFTFNPRLHEPSPQRVMGRDFRQGGVEQGRAVLTMLARHRATATHVARKLVRHFISDDPAPFLVERLAKVFRETDGNLKEVAKALVVAPEAAEMPRGKLRPPAEWVIGIARVMGSMPGEIAPMMQAHNMLGQPLWRPPAPKGFSDETSAWIDGIAGRLDIATQFARRNVLRTDVRAMAEESFGPLLTQDTRQTLARAESQQQAFALLLMSPEFQRR